MNGTGRPSDATRQPQTHFFWGKNVSLESRGHWRPLKCHECSAQILPISFSVITAIYRPRSGPLRPNASHSFHNHLTRSTSVFVQSKVYPALDGLISSLLQSPLLVYEMCRLLTCFSLFSVFVSGSLPGTWSLAPSLVCFWCAQ